MKRNQSGFTLIEIAIVLVIIGLLLGGVLKGQELINSARVKNLATDFRNVPIFIYGYQDKFRALPGDDSQAESHVSAATGDHGDGNGVIDGKWDEPTNGAGKETQLFWAHVRLANLAAGPTSGTDLLPTNALGGLVGITNGGANNPDPAAAGSRISGTYIMCSGGIPGRFAKQLDITMDDGGSGTGSMREFIPSTRGGALTAAPTTLLDGDAYVVCMGI